MKWKKEIEKIFEIKDMFGLPQGTILEIQDERKVAVYDAPEKEKNIEVKEDGWLIQKSRMVYC